MKNRLEEFVHRHRDEFDADAPANDLWAVIEQHTEQKPVKIFRLFTLKQLAASLLILVNAVAIFFLVERKNTFSAPVENAPREQVTNPGYEKEIDQISRLVEIKQAKLKEVERSNPVLYRKFTDALDQLNNSYRQLEKELNTNPNREALLEAMIQNLSLQQELLNRQLTIYQTLKQSRNEKNTISL
ncbi:MAG: hypothetical protein JO301_07895 [Chitinophagaceae bacterium]|nr:hypothetical protein [Chitinophagaceae bacterium]